MHEAFPLPHSLKHSTTLCLVPQESAHTCCQVSKPNPTTGNSGHLCLLCPEHAVHALLGAVVQLPAAELGLILLVPALLIELGEKKGNFSAG